MRDYILMCQFSHVKEKKRKERKDRKEKEYAVQYDLSFAQEKG